MPSAIVAAAAAAAGVLAAPAAAHVVVTPGFLPTGGSGTLTLEVPNERDVEMTAFEITLPAGLTADQASDGEGFVAAVDGDTVTWSGGSVAPKAIVRFELVATADAAPGTLTLDATERFADGETVDWEVKFTITPASGESPDDHWGRAFVAAVIGVVVLAGSYVLLRRLRGRTSN